MDVLKSRYDTLQGKNKLEERSKEITKNLN